MPIPQAEIKPLSDHWYLKDIKQERTATGEKIVVKTDVPVYLWMRWTLIEPGIHRVPITRRGLTTMNDLYFCFDVYEDNLQLEAEESLEHTFIKEPWPYCQTRWFYFWGTVNGEVSPSTSPIFQKHPVAPEYADACYRKDDLCYHYLYQITNSQIAHPFIPCRDYNADKISVWLSAHPYYEYPPAEVLHIAITETDAEGKPIGPWLTENEHPITLVREYACTQYSLNFPLVHLEQDKRYAWVIWMSPMAWPDWTPHQYLLHEALNPSCGEFATWVAGQNTDGTFKDWDWRDIWRVAFDLPEVR